MNEDIFGVIHDIGSFFTTYNEVFELIKSTKELLAKIDGEEEND